MAYEKMKKSFTIDGVDYKDIIGYDSNNIFNVSVAGTASMIRQYMKAKYPKFSGAGVLWINSQSFANGNSIRVRFNRIPKTYYDTIKNDLDKFEYGNYHSGKSNPAYKDGMYNGMVIDYGTKYLTTNNEPPYDSKEAKMEAPDWDSILKSEPKKNTYQKRNSTGSSSKTYVSNANENRELLYKFASGWELYKTVISDNSIVYSIEITKQVKRLQYTDFALLKGTMLTQEGFKWNPNRYRFEKWSKIDDSAISLIDDLLTKYYGTLSGSGTNQQPTPQPTQTQDELPIKVGEYFRYPDLITNKKYNIYKIVSINNDIVYTTFRNLLDNSIGDKDFNLTDLKTSINNKVIMICDYDGNPIKSNVTETDKEEVSKAIKALGYLVQAGDVEAEKAIKALKYLI